MKNRLKVVILSTVLIVISTASNGVSTRRQNGQFHLEKTIAAKKEIVDEVTVTVTRYNPTPGQCNSDCLTTADGSKINLAKLKNGDIRWIAVSRDLLSKYKYGSVVFVDSEDGNIRGYYEVHDTMNKRWRKRIDILTHVSSDHGAGLWKEVRITRKT